MADSRNLHNRDRLSELPDSLIVIILSFLEMRDAVRTTVLSKRWNDRWSTVPSLNFGCPEVGDLNTYRSFVNGALLRWKGAKILRLNLPFSSVNPPSRDLDLWLLFAIGKQVEELCMCLRSYYSLPQRLYTCSSIRKLTLSSVKLRIPENVQLSQLTSLTVEGRESLSGLGLTRLLSGAPMLEELALLCMEIREVYSIQSESLKKLRIGRRQRGKVHLHSVLRIWTPNLSSLELRCSFYANGSCVQLFVPSLTTAILYCFYQLKYRDFWFHQIIGSIRHVQSLTLSDGCIEHLLDLTSKGMSVEFSNAKHVQLFLYDKAVDEKLLALLRMFPNILTLIATLDCYTEDVDSFSASEKRIDIPLPHLKTCEISFHATNSSVFRAIKAVLENGEMLEKMVLRLRYNEETLISDTFEKLLSMRRSSPKARVIISKDYDLEGT